MFWSDIKRSRLITRLQRDIQSGNSANAYSLAQKYITSHPNDRTASQQIFDIFLENGKYSMARDIVDHAINACSDDINLFMRKGLAHIRLNDLQQAEESLQRAYSLDNENVSVLVNLGVVALQKNHPSDAKDLFDRALDIEPDHPDARINRALICIGDGNNAGAEEGLRAVLKKHPDHLGATLNLGRFLVETARLDDAVTILQAARKYHPENCRLICELGKIALLEGLHDEAKQYADMVLGMKPRGLNIYLDAAILLRDTGEYPRAEQVFRKILEKHPDHALTHFNLSFLLLIMGRFEEGWREYEYRKFTGETPDQISDAAEWGGQPLDGKLLVYAEQGIGDEIMFASCLPDVMQDVGSVYCSAIRAWRHYSGDHSLKRR